MSNSRIIRELNDDQKPLCPNMSFPGNKEHELRVRIIDAFYESAEKDADDEFVNSDTEKAYFAAAHDKISDRMNLYTTSVGWMSGSKQIIVESYWFKCEICGLILPAYERRNESLR